MSQLNYECQEAISGLNVPETVTVVGTGAYGAWVAYFAALSGVNRIVLINPGNEENDGKDGIHDREVVVGPYDYNHLGGDKTTALKELIARMRPSAEVVNYIQKFNPEEDADKLEGVVFAGVSGLGVYTGIFEAAANKGLACYGGGYDGLKWGSFSEVPSEFEISPNLPVWNGSAAMSALTSIYSAFAEPGNFYGSTSAIYNGAPGGLVIVDI